MLPTTIPPARLPETYQRAQQALADCQNIDECQSWADKAEALASYAKQADDDSLRKMADRIQARAIRRAGELLKQIEPSKGGRPPEETREGDRPSLSRKQAANEAGMSDHQRKSALRVANVPDEEFERQVESDNPPTVTKLAEQGKKKKEPPAHLEGRTADQFNKCLHFEGMFKDQVRQINKWRVDEILPLLTERERSTIREAINEIDAIHDYIITRI